MYHVFLNWGVSWFSELGGIMDFSTVMIPVLNGRWMGGLRDFSIVMIPVLNGHGRYHGFKYCHDTSTKGPMGRIMDFSTVMIPVVNGPWAVSRISVLS